MNILVTVTLCFPYLIAFSALISHPAYFDHEPPNAPR